MEIKCIKTIGWWIFKSRIVVHTWEIQTISKFMSTSTTFHVHKICKNCAARKTEKFVEKDTLILMGIPVEEIEKITDWEYYHPQKIKDNGTN